MNEPWRRVQAKPQTSSFFPPFKPSLLQTWAVFNEHFPPCNSAAEIRSIFIRNAQNWHSWPVQNTGSTQLLVFRQARPKADHDTVALSHASSCALAFGTPPGHRAPQPQEGHHRHTKPGQGQAHRWALWQGEAPYHWGSWLWLPLSLPSSAPINHFHAPAERYDISAWRMPGHPREPALLWQGCETKETSASETLLYSLLLKKQNLYVQ